MHPAIHATDLALLLRLQNEMSPDLHQLAADLGLSLPQLQQRLRFFEEQGWLRGFFGQLLGRPLGLDVTAFVLLTCQHSTLWDEISALTLTEDEIQECHTLGGEWTHLLKIQTPSTSSLDALIHRIQEWPAITRTQNLVVMATPKQTTSLPLTLLHTAPSTETNAPPPNPPHTQNSATSQSQLPAAQKPTPSQSQLPAAQKPATSQSQLPSTQKPATSQSQLPSTQKPTPSQSQLPAAQKPATSQSQLPSAQKPTPSRSQLPSAQKPTPSQSQLPAAPPLSQTPSPASKPIATPITTSKATSYYPATTARIAVQEAHTTSVATPPTSATTTPPTAPPITHPSSSALPALPALSSPSTALPAIPPFPSLSSPAGVLSSAPNATHPPALPSSSTSLPQATETAASTRPPLRDPLSSISAAVDILLPSIEIDVIGELDIATRAASNPQLYNAAKSKDRASFASSDALNAVSSALSHTKDDLALVDATITTDLTNQDPDENNHHSEPLPNETHPTTPSSTHHTHTTVPPNPPPTSAPTPTATTPAPTTTPSDTTSDPKLLNERIAFLKRKRDAQHDSQDDLPSKESISSVSSASRSSDAVSIVSQSSLPSASPSTQSAEIGGVSISAHSQGSVSMDDQIASLPSAFANEAGDHEPSTLVAPAPALPPHESPSETRQDLSSIEPPPLPSVDSTNPGVLLSSVDASAWLTQGPTEPNAWTDEDPTFEVMIETLEVDELRMVEVLSAVKRMFWSKLRDLSSQCSNENVIAFLHSLDLSPIRMTLRETAQQVVDEIAEVYAQKLDEIADARQLDLASRVPYILDQERRDRITSDIRTPFREFVERLERLDQARDGMLLLLNDQISAQLSRQKPLLSASLLHKLQRVEEPRSIETAWALWLEALKRAMTLYQAEAPDETTQIVLALEQFISQFEPTYSAILNRILEIWTDKLLPPLEALIDA